jgi:predicted nucleotidyltransferase
MLAGIEHEPQSLFWIGSKMNHVEQNLINEIVALLIREDLHTRAIADQLKSNHATVLRKLRDLSEDNIVDFRIEGKNKVFNLKRTIEGRNAAMIAEIYKQSSIVSKYPVLRGIFQAIQEMPEIPLAILYGSYAKSLATKGSDIDIFIETTDSRKKKHLEQRHSLLSVKIGVFDTKDLLIREMMKDHVIIRGAEVYFDKTGFFEKTA